MEFTVKIDKTDAIQKYCEQFPTCEGCGFRIEHEGCYFRGKTPKEWTQLNAVWEGLFNGE